MEVDKLQAALWCVHAILDARAAEAEYRIGPMLGELDAITELWLILNA